MTINQEALEKYGVRRFDTARYLKTDEDIAGYLTEVLADGDMDALLKALNNVARARGMSQVAEAAGVGRESLYKALSKGAKPRFDTINKVLNALGVCLRAEPAKPKVTRTGVATYSSPGRRGIKTAKTGTDKGRKLQRA